MKRHKIFLLAALIVVTIFSFTFYLKKAEAQSGRPKMKTLESVDLGQVDGRLGRGELEIICDASRGNVVYVATGYRNIPVAIAVVHQPDLCK